MSIDLIPGVTKNRQGHTLIAVHQHVGKNGQTYADCLSFAPDLNDLDDEGKPKVYIIPIVSVIHLIEMFDFEVKS